MTYTYPENEIFPSLNERFTPPSEVANLKNQFINDGKILATDQYFSKETSTSITTHVFASQANYNEWVSHPIIIDYIEKRDEFLLLHKITKSRTFTEI
jgi:hypothetical protein